MYLSAIVAKTIKEDPAKVESLNAKLLIRAGFIQQEMAGVYTFLPLGMRVLDKIETIVKEEMNTISSQILMPALCPKKNWETTGRIDVDILLAATPANSASKKTNDAGYILNCSHEEVVTPLVQTHVQSYKELPVSVYQIQTKFRNEGRPKSGLMRTREFRMKDMYSFHTSEDDMNEFFHHKAKPAYIRTFERLGLGDTTVIVQASGGIFSPQPSIEFQTKCKNGEDLVFHVPDTDLYFNKEITPSKARAWSNENEPIQDREDIEGKGIIGVEALAKFLHIEVERTTKTLLYETDDGRLLAAVVRGDYDINEEKLSEVANCISLQLAKEEMVREVTGAEVGYAGPINLPKNVEIFWDDSTQGRINFECGANETNMHTVNANFGRDIDEPAQFYDIKEAQEGDIHPETKKQYETFRASETGNIFTLYEKYSKAFHFTFKDQNESDQPVLMGCYGLGTSRVMGVIAEICNDENGLVWPESVAPAHVHIVPIAKSTEDEAYIKAIELYETIRNAKKDCLLDDRLKLSVGGRLADADLIGVPHRIVISPKTLAEGNVEYKNRKTGEVQMIAFDQILNSIIE